MLHRYFWTLFQWTWKYGEVHIKPFDSNIDVDNRLTKENSDDDETVVMKIIKPHEEYRTLGLLISANGLYKKQENKMKRQITICCTKSGAVI